MNGSLLNCDSYSIKGERLQYWCPSRPGTPPSRLRGDKLGSNGKRMDAPCRLDISPTSSKKTRSRSKSKSPNDVCWLTLEAHLHHPFQDKTRSRCTMPPVPPKAKVKRSPRWLKANSQGGVCVSHVQHSRPIGVYWFHSGIGATAG